MLDPKDREATGARLLSSSARNSYDPEIDIDWDAPLAEGKAYLPLHRVSLYGTEIWERLTPEQRIELSKHEIGSVASVGLWFEIVLIQLLARYVYDKDPRTAHAQYALTEIGDETRHIVMFAKAIERFGLPRYGPPRVVHELARAFKAVSGGASMFASVLVAEEITDRLQRSMMDAEDIQPLIRMVNRIHVVEEARHVRYAREELVRLMPTLGKAKLELHRLVTAVVGFAIVDSLIDPNVYKSIGIDPAEGRRAALRNPHHQATRLWMGEKITEFLGDVGMIGGRSTKIWRRAHLLP
ncbi:AurF N-oxygenase family protein [Herbihabitans rhizosphaerae]|nr:diiron oxygenase [Herbihabitans rhizosphaerae]